MPPIGHPDPVATEFHHRYVEVAGLRLHCVQCGPGDGPLVVLLHGFPEFWYSWRRQMPALARAGFRAAAVDQRGYNLSDKPPKVSDYSVEKLRQDVAGLIEELGEQQADIVGHDWGGVVAWSLAMSHPERVRRLAVLNAPHPAAFLREIRRPAQLLRSSYMLFFQIPWLPERLLSAFDCALIRGILKADPLREAFSDEDIARYVESLSRPGALTSALNYYRALFRRTPSSIRRQIAPIACPTLLIWAEDDRYLGLRLSEGLEPWVPEIELRRIPECSHWVQMEAPSQVNELLLEFLSRADATGRDS